MQKAEFISVLRYNLTGGVASPEQIAKYPSPMLAEYVEMGVNDILKQILLKVGITGDHSMLDPYTVAFKNVPVMCDPDTKELYSYLPAPIVQLPNQLGVRQISPMEDQKSAGNYVDNDSDQVYNKLEGANMPGIPFKYKVEGEKIIYQRLIAGCDMLMKLVVPFTWFDDDIELPVAYAGDSDIFSVIRGLLGIVTQIPEDKMNDNVTPTAR